MAGLMCISGFRNLNQAQLLTDQLFYSDSIDPQQWLVYYISRPLVGSYEPIKITPAILPDILKNVSHTAQDTAQSSASSASPPTPPKKTVKTFSELLNQFPMIAKQMQSGLEEAFKDFQKAMNDWVPSGPLQSTPMTRQQSRSSSIRSNGSIHSSSSIGRSYTPIAPVQLAEEAEFMRSALEQAVTTAIELFQKVDKHQLSFLGTSTELTGPAVEKMIEQYVAEHLHDSFLFPRLCNSSKMEDFKLEQRVHSMQCVDLAQVGIAIETREEKDKLLRQISQGVEEFRKIGVAGSPQQTLGVLLRAQKLVTGQVTTGADEKKRAGDVEVSEKPTASAMNADTLVSLMLMVVIRSQVRHLHARLAYMRDFSFIEDVDSGEAGYALSTFEAVLSYLSTDSAGLKNASSRNRKLWQAIKQGDVDVMRVMLEDSESAIEDEPEPRFDSSSESTVGNNVEAITDMGYANGSRTESESQASMGNGHIPESSTLTHGFPFENTLIQTKKQKKVSMDERSLSNASAYSFVSGTTTLDSLISGIEGDTSIETLAQTQDLDGSSLLMMAVEARQLTSFDYLLSMEAFFPLRFILEDSNTDGSTLLMAAIQLSTPDIVNKLLQRLSDSRDQEYILNYLRKPDNRGRTVAHYLFHAPWLLDRLGDMLPWTQKDRFGQTPLLAICRSYDHPNYSDMVDTALKWAEHFQDGDKPLHLDDHVDAKGNTLLHVVNDPAVSVRLLQQCDSDPNATNDRKFTPLMQASKFGRMDVVRALFGDPRIDFLAKENRGLTAVELAKDDEIRNRIDDMVLVSNIPAPDGRVTTIVRSFFVEDASVRMILKSATRNGDMISITTGRRSLADFMNLAKWLALEHPACWLPSIFKFRSPFQIASRPSKAVLEDIQNRLDRFLKIMISHSTFSTHELLWEFILFPEIQPDMMAERSQRKAALRRETILEEYDPVEDVTEVTSFVDHARESIRGIDLATKTLIRSVVAIRLGLASKCRHMKAYRSSADVTYRRVDISLPPRYRSRHRHFPPRIPPHSSAPPDASPHPPGHRPLQNPPPRSDGHSNNKPCPPLIALPSPLLDLPPPLPFPNHHSAHGRLQTVRSLAPRSHPPGRLKGGSPGQGRKSTSGTGCRGPGAGLHVPHGGWRAGGVAGGTCADGEGDAGGVGKGDGGLGAGEAGGDAAGDADHPGGECSASERDCGVSDGCIMGFSLGMNQLFGPWQSIHSLLGR